MTDVKVPTPAPIKKEKKKASAQQLLNDLLLGGVVGAIAKTAMAPVERVKLLMQTMESNPDVISGKIPPYKGMGDCFNRTRAEQGMKSFWRGNLVNCLSYATQKVTALAFNDVLNEMFPNYSSNTDYCK
jgi:solute carrier family 25 (adenine nucleotide translocator) protein 4/5/6/31